MFKKDDSFFGGNIENIVLLIVLVVVGLLSAWFLLTRVLISPNRVEYNNKKFSPDDIDKEILKQAEVLEDKLTEPAKAMKPYEPNIDNFVAMMDSPIKNIDENLYTVAPYFIGEKADGIYNLPEIVQIANVEIEHIRTVAYVPTGLIDEENIYSGSNSEPNDLDLVTVSGRLEFEMLNESFHRCFAGSDVKQQWRDPCLAVPVFAAVQLFRQEKSPDGNWSEWEAVPRTKIDSRNKMLEVIENVVDLPPGGIKVRMLQFRDLEVKKDLLQPASYNIALAKDDWFPPELHREFEKIQQEIAQEAKQKELEEKKKQKEEELQKKREERKRQDMFSTPMLGNTRTSGYSASGSEGERKRKPRMGRAGASPENVTVKKPEPEKTEKKELSTDPVYEEFKKVLITDETYFTERKEPLLFWAHDDTVRPGGVYRYKIRYGVFNPIVGTNQFSEQYKSYQDDVILWSEFSEATDAVEIPRRIYFFPIEAQQIGPDKKVKTRVSKYVLGNWYSKDGLSVGLGEVIGGIVDLEPEPEQKDILVPSTIDYNTGALLMDVVAVNDWSAGQISGRPYFDMLYSYDGSRILHLPIGQTYWPQELIFMLNEIKRAEQEPRQPIRSWTGSDARISFKRPVLSTPKFDDDMERIGRF